MAADTDNERTAPAAEDRRRAQTIELPAAARALSSLPRLDYSDAYRVDVGGAPHRSGEQWARETLEGAPERLRGSLRRGWFALGLKLGPAEAEGSVLGWQVRHSDESFALLGADSRIGMPAELLFKTEGDSLLVATFVWQRNPIVKAIWAAVVGPHRRIVPYLLGRAAERAAVPTS